MVPNLKKNSRDHDDDRFLEKKPQRVTRRQKSPNQG